MKGFIANISTFQLVINNINIFSLTILRIKLAIEKKHIHA